MSIRLPIHFAVALIAALAIGCGEPFGPGDVTDAYALRRVGSDPLPAVAFSNESFRMQVLADTLFLRADGTGSVSGLRIYEDLLAGSAPEAVPVDIEFLYRVKNARIEIDFECPINASCVAPPHIIARLTGGGLRVDYALGMRVPQYYERLDSSFLRRDR